MATNRKIDDDENDILAQVIVPTLAVSKDIEFLQEKFGFKMLNIFPDDDPEVAVLYGHGLHLRLRREKEEVKLKAAEFKDNAKGNKIACKILLLTDDEEILKSKNTDLMTPGGGAMVRVEPKSYKIPDIEALRHNLRYFDIEIDHATERQISDPSSKVWVVGRAGMLYRDILPSRLGGLMSAEHIWIPKGGPVPDNVHFHTIRFQLIYCLKGWVRLVYEDQGEPFILNAGDCVTQPPEIRHRVIECSDNLQVIEIGVPSRYDTSNKHL